jgi:two-component sensor histidine kinase
MKNSINRLVNFGVKAAYLPWEIYLTRKLNAIVFLSMVNMIFGITFFASTGYTTFLTECILSLVILPFVPLLNYYKNYVWASYLFFGSAFLFFIPFNLKMGLESYMILFYFPVIISLVQLLGRKETWKHLLIISVFCFLTVVIIAIGYKDGYWDLKLSKTISSNLSIFNIIVSFSSTIAFALIMVIEAIAQDTLIKKMLHEKEILLAEVFHRVKNNMNIVTSLLNLKKITSQSQETKDALEECRNRVFSMALVHQNIFNNDSLIGLNFKNYIVNLVDEIAKSFGDQGTFEINYDLEEIQLDLSTSIPCGLIINELITNSFKYAQLPNQKLRIDIQLTNENGKIRLYVHDNGPGIADNFMTEKTTLGMELIESLSEQINGKSQFNNENGASFELIF